MNENPKWKVARLDDFERRGSFIPVREFLGIHSFGMNARVPGEGGTLVNEHDESLSGQEEVYVVLEGTATFEVDDETFRHLRRSVELYEPFREQARADDDLAAVRDDPRFEEALR